MKLLITGICGFVGSSLAEALIQSVDGLQIIGMDSLTRNGSWTNRDKLASLGVDLCHGDVRLASDMENLPKVDWVIDAAAQPSVLAGVDGRTSSRQLIEHNLLGTINLLEFCRKTGSGFILLSTSRVYSITPLTGLRMKVEHDAFVPEHDQASPRGFSLKGISEEFSIAPPVSLYGSTKVASEHLALEYGETFKFPVWINRCGVMAGAGQFGHPAQGIFAYWIHSFRERNPLKYIGFGGTGYQVRDCLHPRDLVPLLELQFSASTANGKPRTINASGGLKNSMSLCELTNWCSERFGAMPVESSTEDRPFDIPWIVLDASLAASAWNWQPRTSLPQVLEEIAHFAESHPDWLAVSKA